MEAIDDAQAERVGAADDHRVDQILLEPALRGGEDLGAGCAGSADRHAGTIDAQSFGDIVTWSVWTVDSGLNVRRNKSSLGIQSAITHFSAINAGGAGAHDQTEPTWIELALQGGDGLGEPVLCQRQIDHAIVAAVEFSDDGSIKRNRDDAEITGDRGVRPLARRESASTGPQRCAHGSKPGAQRARQCIAIYEYHFACQSSATAFLLLPIMWRQDPRTLSGPG